MLYFFTGLLGLLGSSTNSAASHDHLEVNNLPLQWANDVVSQCRVNNVVWADRHGVYQQIDLT